MSGAEAWAAQQSNRGCGREEQGAWEAECGSVGAAADPRGFTASSAVTTFPLTGTHTFPLPLLAGWGRGRHLAMEGLHGWCYSVFTLRSLEEGGGALIRARRGVLETVEGGVGETEWDLENWKLVAGDCWMMGSDRT